MSDMLNGITCLVKKGQSLFGELELSLAYVLASPSIYAVDSDPNANQEGYLS
jgi:hypothetical protein